jgi:DNA-binding Xre family transcriptional regulator
MLKQFRFKKIKITQKIKVNKMKRTKTVTRHAFRVIQLETNAKTIQVQKIKINQKIF